MGVPKRTFIDQLTLDTGCKEPELKTAMTNWNKADMSANAELALSSISIPGNETLNSDWPTAVQYLSIVCFRDSIVCFYDGFVQ